MNARLVERTETEKEYIGPFIFNPEEQGTEYFSDEVAENREMFLEYCIEHEMIPMNTWFEKPDKDLVTFRNTYAPKFAPPWDRRKYSQVDFAMVNRNAGNTKRARCPFSPFISSTP